MLVLILLCKLVAQRCPPKSGTLLGHATSHTETEENTG